MFTANAANPLVLAINFNVVGKMDGDKSQKEWATFNDGFTNVEITTEQFIDNIRAGHSFCAQHVHTRRPLPKPDGTIRLSRFRNELNWGATSVVAGDWDDGAPPPEQMEDDPFVRNYACAGYTTVSHTPENPHYRIVWNMNKPIMHLANYKALLDALAWQYQLDPCSKDAVKAYAGNNTASFVRMNLNDNRLPLGVARDLITRHESAVAEERKGYERVRDASNDTEWGADDIAEMLSFMPKHQSYDDWFKTLVSVHSVFPDETGISLCESWAPGTSGEIETKWRSIHKHDVTIAWLIVVSQKHGYMPPWVRSRITTSFIAGALRHRQ